jgi:hypothetical protein
MFGGGFGLADCGNFKSRLDLIVHLLYDSRVSCQDRLHRRPNASIPSSISSVHPSASPGLQGTVACSPSDQSILLLLLLRPSASSPSKSPVLPSITSAQPRPAAALASLLLLSSQAFLSPSYTREKPTKIRASRRPASPSRHSAHARCIVAIEKGSRPAPPPLL